MGKFKPIQSDIPTMKDIERMTLEELNKAILKFGRRENRRLLSLERYGTAAEATLLAAKRLAGKTSPLHDLSGLAYRFNIKSAGTVQEARSRLADITKALRYKTGTVTGLKEMEEQRLRTMSELVGIPLSGEEFTNIVRLLEQTRNSENMDSNQVLDMMRQEVTSNKFDSINDLMKFVEDQTKSGRPVLMEYERLNTSHALRYDPATKTFK